MQAARKCEGYVSADVLYMALELSGSKWRVAFGADGRARQVTVAAGDLSGLLEQIERAKQKLGVDAGARVRSCYEAGRDGFWLHRALCAQGIENLVVDAASIEVSRRARRVKTDRVDAQKLLAQLERYCRGERRALRVVRVPSVQAEDARRIHRERERLLKERGMHGSRIRALLIAQGVELELKGDFAERLRAVRLWDDHALGAGLRAELEREWQRLEQVQKQLKALEAEQRAEFEQVAQSSEGLMQRLSLLQGIGMRSAWVLTRELFGWRQFANRRELAGCVGLTPTPYNSGGSEREQGISKAGNRRVRALLIELSWLWLRYQPDSALSAWYRQRFGGGGARARRIGIVALARRLLIALWRYLEQGLIPEGARLKSCAA